MSGKGQWFIISAVIASATFVTISMLYSGYFYADSSKIAKINEDFFFNNIVYELNNTLGYSANDYDFQKNLMEFVPYAEQKALEKGYYLKIENTGPPIISGTNFIITMSSSNMNITRAIKIPLD
jgi:hypothetical protein